MTDDGDGDPGELGEPGGSVEPERSGAAEGTTETASPTVTESAAETSGPRTAVAAVTKRGSSSLGEIHLKRADPAPWGFRLMGGRDYSHALTVTRVSGLIVSKSFGIVLILFRYRFAIVSGLFLHGTMQ